MLAKLLAYIGFTPAPSNRPLESSNKNKATLVDDVALSILVGLYSEQPWVKLVSRRYLKYFTSIQDDIDGLTMMDHCLRKWPKCGRIKTLFIGCRECRIKYRANCTY